MQTSRGSLIVLEGLDRTGKSTLAMRLVEQLNNKTSNGNLDIIKTPTSYYKFPDRTTLIGKMIDSYLRKEVHFDDHSIHLLFSANRWECCAHFKQLIYEGRTLVVDRYSYSGAAYSGAKKGMDLNWCYNQDIGLPRPDLLIYLTLSATEQKKRQGFGDEIYEETEFQNCIRENYNKIFERSREEATKNNETFNFLNVVADGKSPDDLLAEILEPVRQCIQENARQPLKNIT